MTTANENRDLRQQLTASLAAVPVRDLPGNGASFPTTREEAQTRLNALRTDKEWSRRYFAGDKGAIAEYDHLIRIANGLPEPERIVAQPRTAADMRCDAELRYDGPIPAEVLAAIAAQEQSERDARMMSGMTEADRLRFRAAKEFRLAKRAFRVLCAMTRRRTVRRPDAAWFQLRDRARAEAEAHLEAWRTLRHREARA